MFECTRSSLEKHTSITQKKKVYDPSQRECTWEWTTKVWLPNEDNQRAEKERSGPNVLD